MTHCPWCNNTAVKPYLHVKDDVLSQEEFDIFECPHCHLLFTDPRPAPSKISAYYESKEYYSHQENKSGFIPKIYEAVKKVNLQHKVSLALGDLPVGHLLDIGCGVGDFLIQAKQAGWTVQGIEPSQQARTIASQRSNLHPLMPSEAHTLANASFDVITLWHVLEHIDDLHAQIADFVRLLKPGGRLVLALPNFKSADAEYYREYWAAYDVPRHLNHFCRESINNIFKNTRLKLKKTDKLIWDAYYISYMSEKYKNHSLPLVKGTIRGLMSNCKARQTGEWSSLVYVLEG